MLSEHAGFGFMTIARAVKGANWVDPPSPARARLGSPAALARPTSPEIESSRRSAAIPRQNYDI